MSQPPAALLHTAIASIAAGRWAVGVSGGADSVALLHALQRRSDLSLHIVHLNHELRGAESDQDARFVEDLAARLHLQSTVLRRSDFTGHSRSKNPSEQYRRSRLAAYAQVIQHHELCGVLLAHHRDDQIETVLHRLLRGSGYRGLCGMAEEDRVAGVLLCRPLLNVSRSTLRQFLQQSGQAWREDSSNAGSNYARNRLRKFLLDRPVLGEAIWSLKERCSQLRANVDAVAIRWPNEIDVRAIQLQPRLLDEHSARRWLIDAGVPAVRVDARAIDVLLQMIHDAAAPPRVQLPGGKLITRRGGRLTAK